MKKESGTAPTVCPHAPSITDASLNKTRKTSFQRALGKLFFELCWM